MKNNQTPISQTARQSKGSTWAQRGRTLAIMLMTTAALSTAALALDANEQATLNQASSVLKQADGNLEAARSSAGTAEKPATGSRLRLTQMRLDSAKQGLAKTAELLSKLPADDDATKPVMQQYAASAALAAQIEAIINPNAQAPAKEPAASGGDKGASTPAAPAAAAPDAPKVPKLHYQQEDLLKNAQFHLRDAAGYGNAAAAVLTQIDDPKTTVVHGQVVKALASLTRAQEKLKNATNTLDKLPADHPSVASVITQAKETSDTYGAIRSRLEAEEAKLDKLANLKYYPDYEKDRSLLQELSGRYRDFKWTMQQPELLAQVISEDSSALKEIQRIARTYLPLVQQKTDAGEIIERQFNYFQTQRGAFAQELSLYKKVLPGAFEKHLDDALKLAEQAVAEKKPMYFGENSGIEQNLGFAEQKLLVIEALGKEAAAPYTAKLKATRDEIKVKGKALEQQIIATNTLPPDNYQGQDRDAIIAVAKDGWSHQQKDANVLMSRIPSQAWTRETKWEWFAGAFSKVDRSRLQVQLIIKRDDKTAVVQPVNIYKDHLKGDTMIGSPMRSGDEEVQPQSILLLEKVK